MIRIDPPPAPWWHRLRRHVRRRRRSAAAVFAATAVAVVTVQITSLLTPPVTDVVVVQRSIAAGATVTRADVDIGRWPEALVPPLAIRTVAEAVGRTAAGRMTAGEPVTTARLAEPAADVDTAGRVLVVVGLADWWSLTLVAPGSLVDVHAPTASWVDGATPVVPQGPVAQAAIVVRVLGAGQHTLEPEARGDAMDPYASGSYGTDPYGTDPYGTDPYGTDPYGAGIVSTATGPALVLAVRPTEAAGLAGLSGQGFGISTAPGASTPG